MRLRIAALATAILASAAFSSALGETASGGLEVQLKARATADAQDDQKVTLYRKSKALVIGMDHYDGAWPQLVNGIKDAEEVAKGLSAQGFEVILKKDLKADDLDRTLKNFFVVEGGDPDARLLLWFAGHGDTIGDEAYLVPTDAPSATRDIEFRAKAISLRRFGEYMREAKAKHVLAIFDACFSGSVFNVARSLPPPAITLATTEPVREFISSGEAEQTVSDDGTFRKLFLDVLAGREPDADANHDGYVTGTELGLFLHQKMTNLTRNRQTPRYGKLNALGYDRGDFVFQVGEPQMLASLASQTALPAKAGTDLPNADIARLLQFHLKRVGCDPGDVDGKWNADSRRAMESFNKYSGRTLDVTMANLDALDAVRGMVSRVCPLTCRSGFRLDGDHCVAIECEAGHVRGSDGACHKREQKAAEGRTPRTDAAPRAGGKCFSFNGKQFCE